MPDPITLYNWQEEAVDALRGNIASGCKNQILASPTGSGKTVIASYLMQSASEKRTRCIFICDRLALIEQTSAVLDGYDINHGIIQSNHWRWRPWLPVQIASAQTLARRDWPEDVGLIIVDEAHSVYRSIAARIKERTAVTIGLSATPLTRGIGRIYDEVVTVRTHDQLTNDGYLAPWVAYSTGTPDMRGAKVSAGEWSDAEAEQRAMPIVGSVVAEYMRNAPGEKFIAFGCTVRHCEEIARQFMSAGIRAGLYTYRTPDVERADMVREFAKPDSNLQGLVSVAALSKGFDAPNVSCIIMARPLRSSLTEHIQVLGRGLRRDPANPDKVCTVLDHAGNMVRFWDRMHDFFKNGVLELDDGKPAQKQERDSDEPPPKQCPKCAHVHKPRPSCPMCGHEYPRPRVEEHADGALTQMNGKRSDPDDETGPKMEGANRDTKQQFYSQLLTIRRERGYKKGWVAHQYRSLFGCWPRGLEGREARPTPWTREWVHQGLKRYALQQNEKVVG